MKRLRLLSISNPGKLARRMHAISWGSSYWINKQRARAAVHHEARFARMLAEIRRMEDEAGADGSPPKQTVH